VEEDNQLGFEFPGLGRRKIEANFAGGQVSSDGGVMLLSQVDRWLGFTKQLGGILPDRRNPLLIQHSQQSWQSALKVNIEKAARKFASSKGSNIGPVVGIRSDALLPKPSTRSKEPTLASGSPIWSGMHK
jgi:hypothetical protein